MHAKELIGELAMRTKFTKPEWGREDSSFTTEPILIINATDSHVYYKKPGQPKDLLVLNYLWVDDWAVYRPEPGGP